MSFPAGSARVLEVGTKLVEVLGLEGVPGAEPLKVGFVALASVALLVLSFGAALLAKPRGAPPVVGGSVPIIGGFLRFLGGPLQLIEEEFQKTGQVFTVPILHKSMTFLIGPEVSAHFFKATDDKLSQKEVYEFNVPTFGKGVVFDVEASVRNEQFRFFADSLKTTKMRTYVQMMVQEADQFFASWPDEGECNLLEKLSELIILTASRCLMGREVREHLFKEVYQLFHDLDNGMQPISVLFPYLPIEAHRKRDASRKKLSELFAKVIQDRRAKGVVEEDVLQSFMDARYKNGGQLTEDQVCGMLIAVLFAGQHTSSITSTWTGLFMMAGKGKNDIWKRAEDEQRAVIKQHGDKLDYDIVNSMDHLHRCMKEALRLHPPLIMLMRYAREAFDVTDKDGHSYTIPKGHIVATSPAYSGRLDHVYTNAESYDPDRFAEPRVEDKAQPFSHIGFGGGRHGCMGETFAYMQVKTIWSVLLRNFDFEFIGSEFPKANLSAMVVGPYADKCQVRFRRRKL